jgi:hypothetical protein
MRFARSADAAGSRAPRAIVKVRKRMIVPNVVKFRWREFGLPSLLEISYIIKFWDG